MSSYQINPADANYKQWEKENRVRRYEYWNRLKKAYADYEYNHNGDVYETDLSSFDRWMQQHWGIAITIVDSCLGSTYQIVDEKKYTLFMLKY